MKTNIISRLLAKPYLFRRFTSFAIEEFQLLADKLEPEWQKKEYQRLSLKERKNRVGQGRKYELETFVNLLLLTLIYLRTTIGYELLGLLFQIDGTTVRRTVKRVTPLLTDRFIPKTELNKYKRRSNNPEDLLANYPELKDVILDGTELKSLKPKKRQKQSYSGKKKYHTKKTQIALDKKTKLIIGVSPPKKGKIHDKKQLEKTNWDKKLPTKIKRYGDLAYLGMNNDENNHSWKIPYKKPNGKELTKKQHKENRKHSKERIPIEHAIRGMKIFRRIAETITIKSNDFLYNVLLASANLYNYKRLLRQGLS